MDTTTECDVLQNVWTVEAEFVGLIEPSWISVCSTVHHKYAGTSLHIDVADLGGASRHAEVRLDRAFEAKHLLDERGNFRMVLAQLRLQVRSLCNHQHRETQ